MLICTFFISYFVATMYVAVELIQCKTGAVFGPACSVCLWCV